jgi:hypothetical protein
MKRFSESLGLSKSDELCRAFKISMNDRIANRDQSCYFIRDLIAGFIRHLQIPQNLVEFLPPPNGQESARTYTLPGAIRMQSNGFWHVRIRLSLHETRPKYPRRPVLLLFRIKKEDHGFRVKIDDLVDFAVDPARAADYQFACEKNFSIIKSHLE